MTYSFVVPGEPVAKGRPRFNRKTGTARTPDKTRDFQAKVALFASQACSTPLDGPVWLEVTAYFPMPKSMHRKRPKPKQWYPKGRDIDNVVKAVADACNGILFHDDRQIVHVVAKKMLAAQGDGPRTIVECGLVTTPAHI